MYTILVASLNENVKLANIIEEQLHILEKKVEIINLIELDLPMYSSLRENDGIHSNVHKLIQKLENSKAYIIVTPEYNYSIPPVLTNTIAWVSRVGDDFRKQFKGKNILLATHSGSGGSDVLAELRKQLSKLEANVYEKDILTTYRKKVDINLLDNILNKFVQQ